MIRTLAGVLASRALRLLAPLPPEILYAMGSPLLPAYARTKTILRHRLTALASQVGFSTPSIGDYYRMRLRLAALSLRHLSGRFGDCPLRIHGVEHFHSALQSGKPIALLGWHQGPVEILHHVPYMECGNRPFYLLAAQGFAPALSNFLRQGRCDDGQRLLEPGDVGLRRWVRENGILAVMMDQVPGKTGESFSLWNGACQIPFPRRLYDFIVSHQAISIPVSVSLSSQSIDFRYHPPLAPEKPAEGLRQLMEKSLSETPGQYNWSYPKIWIK